MSAGVQQSWPKVSATFPRHSQAHTAILEPRVGRRNRTWWDPRIVLPKLPCLPTPSSANKTRVPPRRDTRRWSRCGEACATSRNASRHWRQSAHKARGNSAASGLEERNATLEPWKRDTSRLQSATSTSPVHRELMLQQLLHPCKSTTQSMRPTPLAYYVDRSPWASRRRAPPTEPRPVTRCIH